MFLFLFFNRIILRQEDRDIRINGLLSPHICHFKIVKIYQTQSTRPPHLYSLCFEMKLKNLVFPKVKIY